MVIDARNIEAMAIEQEMSAVDANKGSSGNFARDSVAFDHDGEREGDGNGEKRKKRKARK